MQQRVLNARPSFVVNITEPIGGNYYPMNEIAYIEDIQANLRIAIVTDRTRGVSSQQEVIMHTNTHAHAHAHTHTRTQAHAHAHAHAQAHAHARANAHAHIINTPGTTCSRFIS